MDHKILLNQSAAALMQVTEQEAQGILQWYSSIGYLERLRNAGEWILSGDARKLMGLNKHGAISSASVQDWILAQLEAGEVLSARETAEELGVDRKVITDILRHLKKWDKPRSIHRAHKEAVILGGSSPVEMLVADSGGTSS